MGVGINGSKAKVCQRKKQDYFKQLKTQVAKERASKLKSKTDQKKTEKKQLRLLNR
jgi:hypothetical protein